MPRFAANLSFLFQDIPFLDRFSAAAIAGFQAVEFLFPYEFKAREIKQRLNDYNLTQALFNFPPGNWSEAERGLAALPGRQIEFRDGISKALEYAKALDCHQLHVMAGIPLGDAVPEECRAIYQENLAYAAEKAAQEKRTILIEPINRRDMPGYFLADFTSALDIIKAINAPNLKLQYDLYHAQIIEGDLAHHLEAYMPYIAHIQIANPPHRHEPDRGEINYSFLFSLIDALGYKGWIGCEYRPEKDTLAGLGWAKKFGLGKS